MHPNKRAFLSSGEGTEASSRARLAGATSGVPRGARAEGTACRCGDGRALGHCPARPRRLQASWGAVSSCAFPLRTPGCAAPAGLVGNVSLSRTGRGQRSRLLCLAGRRPEGSTAQAVNPAKGGREPLAPRTPGEGRGLWPGPAEVASGARGWASFVALQTPGMSWSPLWAWLQCPLSRKVLCPAWPLPLCILYPKWLGEGQHQQSQNRNQTFRHKGLTEIKDTQAIVGGGTPAGWRQNLWTLESQG